MTEKRIILGNMRKANNFRKDSNWSPVYSINGIIQTLTSAMGMGGGYVPYVVVKNDRVKKNR